MRIVVLLVVWTIFLTVIERDMARDHAGRRRKHIKMRAATNQHQEG